MGRKSSRELAFKLVFEHLFNDAAEISESLQCIEEDISEEDFNFAKSLTGGVKQNINELIDLIKANLKDYVLERIYKVDLAILLLAAYELKFEKQSAAIIINEAVELAKKYSTDKSPKFVNGVLANILK